MSIMIGLADYLPNMHNCKPYFKKNPHNFSTEAIENPWIIMLGLLFYDEDLAIVPRCESFFLFSHMWNIYFWRKYDLLLRSWSNYLEVH
jgi:hypothetical protein